MPTRRDEQALAEAILATFRSPNERDRNWEIANVVDGLYADVMLDTREGG